jgi:signal transduction histidine kinase
MSSTISVLEPASQEGRDLVEAERLRIARELHDVVAYSFATINVQASVAAHVVDQRPEQAVEALRAIKAISGEASRELRAILGVMRAPRDGEPTRSGLARLDALAATFSRAGLPTRVVVSGRRNALAPAVDGAAYRIAQEALTNALRHAGPASASVTVTYAEERLILEVVDDGGGGPERPAAGRSGSGHGIAGMRERALAVGGKLHAGPRPRRGFRVHACLPSRGRS